jgi:hypothetical protein
MDDDRLLPDDPVGFIKWCVELGQVHWTYHVNMRLARRYIARQTILGAVDTYELVEAYPDDKYLPSYLILAQTEGQPFHVLFATDVNGRNVRIVTEYRPDPRDWQPDQRTRRTKS